MDTRKGKEPPVNDYSTILIKSRAGCRAHNNRALAVLLKELNITLWSVEKDTFFDLRPILEDIRNMALHVNWAFAMRRCRLDRHTLIRALSRNSNPTFQTIIRMLHGMGLRIRVEPDPALTTVVQDTKTHRHQEKSYKRNPFYASRNAAQDGVDPEIIRHQELLRDRKRRGTLRRE